MCDLIVKYFQPTKVILFGLSVNSLSTEDSDMDTLISMPFEGRGAHKSAEIATVTHPRFTVDLLVRAPEQVKAHIVLVDFFISEIVKKRKVLNEA